MAILPIITFPDDFLRQKSLPIESVNDAIRKLMDDMLETNYHDRGVGLAAVQVGVLQRIIVLDLQDDDDVPRDKGFYPLYIANPKITKKSQNTTAAMEGCLSVPEQSVEVVRSESIEVEFLNYNNEHATIAASGWLARVIQHEMDHLEGRLLVDYLNPLKRDIAVRKLMKRKKYEQSQS